MSDSRRLAAAHAARARAAALVSRADRLFADGDPAGASECLDAANMLQDRADALADLDDPNPLGR